MLSPHDLRLKVEEMERRAAAAGGLLAADYRALATQWRLMEVQATFMAALLPPESTESLLPESRIASRG